MRNASPASPFCAMARTVVPLQRDRNLLSPSRQRSVTFAQVVPCNIDAVLCQLGAPRLPCDSMCGSLRYSVLLSSCSQGYVRSCAGYFSKPTYAYVEQNIWLDVESSRAQTASNGFLAEQRACKYLRIPLRGAAATLPPHGRGGNLFFLKENIGNRGNILLLCILLSFDVHIKLFDVHITDV